MFGLKTWAYLGIAIALLTMLGAGARSAYNAGFNAATVKEQALAIEAQALVLAKAKTEWEKTKAASQEQVKIQEKIVEHERIVERRIPVVVEKLVREKPACDDLGADVLGVFNDAIRGGPDPNAAAPTAEPTSRLSAPGACVRLQDRNPALRTQRKYVASTTVRRDAPRFSEVVRGFG